MHSGMLFSKGAHFGPFNFVEVLDHVQHTLCDLVLIQVSPFRKAPEE